MVAQKALQAKASEGDGTGLDAQKKKVGFLERLASVGMGKKSEDAEMSPKMEPDFVPTTEVGRTIPRPAAPPVAAPQTPAAPGPAPGPAPVSPPVQRPAAQQAPAPRRLETPRPPVHAQTAAAVAQVESLSDDDLEIPAFLRRRAN